MEVSTVSKAGIRFMIEGTSMSSDAIKETCKEGRS